jgi:hypothetical protein
MTSTREVPLYTAGQYLRLDHNSADRLECLLFNADHGSRQDVHRFTLCFERASDGVFYMPGSYWVAEFEKRIGRLLKASEIRLATGNQGAASQHDRDCGFAPVKEKR